jgi:hypothetical protein
MSIQKKLITPLAVAAFICIVSFAGRIEGNSWGYILIGMGVACFYGGFVYTRNGKRSLYWPKVNGIVKVSEVRKSLSSGRNGESYEFVVEYDYVVKERAYTNNLHAYKITYNFADSRGARELVKKYPLDALVNVFYDPKEPKRSVLLPGINRWSYLPFLAGVIFILFGIGILTGHVN